MFNLFKAIKWHEAIGFVVLSVLLGLYVGFGTYGYVPTAFDEPLKVMSFLAGTYAFVLGMFMLNGMVKTIKLERQIRDLQAQVNQHLEDSEALMKALKVETPAKRHGIPTKLRDLILRRDGYTCTYCGEKGTAEIGPRNKAWQIDHILPVSKGGTNHPSNLVASCEGCNASKNNQSGGDFLKRKLHFIQYYRRTP